MDSAKPGVESLLGPFVIEVVIASTLFGITLTQAGRYYQHCESDPKVLIIAISVLYLLGFFHIATTSTTLYTYTVLHFGDYAYLVIPPWSFPIGAALTGIFSGVAQVYFARQVYILGGRKKLLPALILFFALLSTTFAIICSGFGYHLGDFRKFDDFEYGVLIWLCTAAACDVLITSGIVFHLRKHRKETSFGDTRTILGVVIANTIENNALTCVVACVDAVLFAEAGRIGAWHVILNGQLVGLYFVSLLTSLNTRHDFAARRETVRRMSSNISRRNELETGNGEGLSRVETKGTGVSGGTALMRMITRGSIAGGGRAGGGAPGGGGGGGYRLPNLDDSDPPALDNPFGSPARGRAHTLQLPPHAFRGSGGSPKMRDLPLELNVEEEREGSSLSTEKSVEVSPQ
ncbi:hypothetical protein BCR35DRAFT_22076 [Leucosporidium creatinivorum]|uniref:DUF6534 domain-containing protein n=1 Tax=Leucosporidium creatinivorum TaxID=106004 RepID=A0A1Y2FXD8_9BASI|nr:hypothetical protein BCR35DRAFT_22076 [Leucosporidium creatinivorum]